MKSFISKNILVFMSLLLVFGYFPAIASANNANETGINVKTLDVHDIVPKEYFKKYSNKFTSKEEVLEASGFSDNTVNTSNTLTKGSSSQTPIEYIKVDSIDEYAALLFYYNELTDSVNEENIQTNNVIQKNDNTINSTYDHYYYTHEVTYNDIGISWMKAFVITKRDSNTRKIIGDPVTDSGLYGFNPGNSYEHNSTRSTVTVNTERTGGKATIVGTLTLFIIIEGIGDVSSKDITLNMTF